MRIRKKFIARTIPDCRWSVRPDIHMEASALYAGRESIEVDFPTAYSGGKLLLMDFDVPVVIDLSTCRVHRDLPILLYHNETRRVGNVRQSMNTGTLLRMTGAIYPALPDAQTVLTVHQGGGVWECSIGTGAVEVANQTYIGRGRRLSVNNQMIVGPFVLMKNVEIRELSFVGAGADPSTEVVINATALTNERSITMNEFEKFCADFGIDIASLDQATLDDYARKFEALKVAAIQASTDTDPDKPDEEEEDKPVAAIQASTETEPDKPEEEDKPVDTIQASGITKALTRLNKLLSLNSTAAGAGRPDSRKVIEASILLRTGAGGKALQACGYSQREIDAATAPEYRSVGLHTLMRRAITASGLTVQRDMTPRELVRSYHDAIHMSGLSTRDFSPTGIMSNVADKILRIQADQIVSVVDQIYMNRAVRNFTSVASGKLDIIGALEDVPVGGNFANASLSDNSQEYSIAKRGCKLAITIEDQYNDDLGAIDRSLRDFGRVWANSRESTGISAITNNVSTLFTTAKKNKATLAFSTANLKSVVAKFQRLPDANGNPRNLVPGAILAGPEIALSAMAMFQFNERAVLTSGAENLFVQAYNTLSTPYITDDTAWYLIARDEMLGEVASIDGSTAPTIEQAQVNYDNLNIEFLVWGTCGFLVYNDLPAVYSKPT